MTNTENIPVLSHAFSRISLFIGIIVFVVAIMLPTPEGLSVTGHRLLAVTLLMGILWATEALPVEITSLIPLAAYPLLGILSPEKVSRMYMDYVIMLYFSGFLLALAVEQSGLHRRIALWCLITVGATPRRLILGMMLATGFLSMWMSNTAITLLMLPLGMAIVQTLTENNLEHGKQGQAEVENAWNATFLLAIAYAASIGGIGTLVGTPTNIAFQSYWEKNMSQVPGAVEISSGNWIMAFTPVMLIFLILTWLWLSWQAPGIKQDSETIYDDLRIRLKNLGRISKHEFAIGLIFFITAILWISRVTITVGSVTLLQGWGDPLAGWLSTNLPEGTELKIEDSTIGILMVLLCCMIYVPQQGQWKPLLDWKSAQANLPWGILLLFGGGFAISEGFKSTGATSWLGNEFAQMIENVPLVIIILGVATLATFVTEFTSNVATINTLLPILFSTALALKIHPLLLMLPATVSASFAFMLPIGTPPNAIVFGTKKIPMRFMMKNGFVLNMIGIILVTLATYVLVVPLFNIKLP